MKVLVVLVALSYVLLAQDDTGSGAVRDTRQTLKLNVELNLGKTKDGKSFNKTLTFNARPRTDLKKVMKKIMKYKAAMTKNRLPKLCKDLIKQSCSAVQRALVAKNNMVKIHKGYYMVNHGTYTWHQARNYCESRGLQLADIQSNEENEALVKYVLTGKTKRDVRVSEYWLDGNDIGHEGLFKWTHTGRKFCFTAWRKDEPNNKGIYGQEEGCVELLSYEKKWNDADCNIRMKSICELPCRI